MDDLRHRPALVGAFGFGVVEHRDRRGGATGAARPRQVATGDVSGGVGGGSRVAVEGVGEDADGDATAIDPEGGADAGGSELEIALGTDGATAVAAADDRGQHLVDRGHPGQLADPPQVRRPRRDRHGPVAVAGLDDLGSGLTQCRQRRRRVGFELDFDEDPVAFAQQAAGPAGGKAELRRLLGGEAERRAGRGELGQPRGEAALPAPDADIALAVAGARAQTTRSTANDDRRVRRLRTLRPEFIWSGLSTRAGIP